MSAFTRRHQQRLLNVVGHQQRRKAGVTPQIYDLSLHGQPRQRVELAQWLVQDQHFRIVDERASERERCAMPPES
jgi:ABC-type Mn2+/Zn2+ transport system ATPase subunit